VDSTGPAAKAGLEQGDIIVGFAGTPITQEADLILALRSAKVGSTVAVKIDRNGKALTLKLTLVEAPSSGAASL
jgi:S1-C subfamily serine protease